MSYLSAVVKDDGELVVGLGGEQPRPEVALVLVLLFLGLLPVGILGDVQVGVKVGEQVDLKTRLKF